MLILMKSISKGSHSLSYGFDYNNYYYQLINNTAITGHHHSYLTPQMSVASDTAELLERLDSSSSLHPPGQPATSPGSLAAHRASLLVTSCLCL